MATPIPSTQPAADVVAEEEPIADFTAIEQQKENIQPLASGRSAAQLVTLFTARTPGSSRKPLGSVTDGEDEGDGGHNPRSLSRMLKEGHTKYRDMIDAMERAERGEEDERGEELLDDPLDVYLQYIRWTLDSYTSGGTTSESRLVPLLESATRKFVRDSRYLNDLRYLKLWTLYARQCNRESARNIFRFLLSNEIGTTYAMLYEEFAVVLEQTGARQEADDMYALGIGRKATPLERLKKRRNAFTLRMANAPPPTLVTTASTTTPAASGSSRLASGKRLAPSGLGNAGTAPVTKSNPNGSKLQIFRDEDENKDSSQTTSSPWEDVGTVRGNKRENEPVSLAMGGQTMPMGKALSTPAKSLKIEVFRDDDAYLQTPAKTIYDPDAQSSTTTPGNPFAPRAPRDSNETQLLQNDPFLHYASAGIDIGNLNEVEKNLKSDTKLTSNTCTVTRVAQSSVQEGKLKASTSVPASTKASAQGTDKASGEKKERVFCNLKLIYPVDEPGAEYSWEEIRANRYMTNSNRWGQQDWQKEVSRTGNWYQVNQDGTPVLYDLLSGEPLFEYLRPAWEARRAELRQAEALQESERQEEALRIAQSEAELRDIAERQEQVLRKAQLETEARDAAKRQEDALVEAQIQEEALKKAQLEAEALRIAQSEAAALEVRREEQARREAEALEEAKRQEEASRVAQLELEAAQHAEAVEVAQLAEAVEVAQLAKATEVAQLAEAIEAAEVAQRAEADEQARRFAQSLEGESIVEVHPPVDAVQISHTSETQSPLDPHTKKVYNDVSTDADRQKPLSTQEVIYIPDDEEEAMAPDALQQRTASPVIASDSASPLQPAKSEEDITANENINCNRGSSVIYPATSRNVSTEHEEPVRFDSPPKKSTNDFQVPLGGGDEDEQTLDMTGRARAAPSPTMNTKAALAEVDDMFAKTLNLDKYGQRGDDDFEEEYEDTFWDKSQNQPQRIFAADDDHESSSSDDEEVDEDDEQLGGNDGAHHDDEEDDDNLQPIPRRIVPYHDPVPQASFQSAVPIPLGTRPASGFKPVRKGPPVAQRLFVVRSDDQTKLATAESGSEDVFGVVDTSISSQATPDASYDSRDIEEPLQEEEARELPPGSGYEMGRQLVSDRFANFNSMSPIVERTCEFTCMTLGDVREKSIVEDDEDVVEPIRETVENQIHHVDADMENGRDVLNQMPVESSSGRNQDSLTVESFEGPTHRSFNNSDASLPIADGHEVHGNQSGHTVEVVFDKIAANHEEADHTHYHHIEPLSKKPPPTPTAYDAGQPVCPFEPEIIECLLQGLEPPIKEYRSFRDLTSYKADRMTSLRKRFPANSRKSSVHHSVKIDHVFDLQLGSEFFKVQEKVGEGAFGIVYKISLSKDDSIMDENDDSSCLSGVMALKVEEPLNLWEYSMMIQLHERLSRRICQCIVSPRRLYAYEDESFLIMDYCSQGTLLDAVNRACDIGIGSAMVAGSSSGFDELLAIFFTVELLRIVEGFHSAGFIHGDLKIDNCLIRLEEAKLWSPTYQANGEDGWSSKGLKLIDFGRTIDTNVFPPGQTFLADWETDESVCPEMRHGQCWIFEPDYYGIASIAYCMLFGCFMPPQENGKKPSFRRYHQVELWNPFFDILLVPSTCNQNAIVGIRGKMEEWLQVNGEKGGKSLKGLLTRLENGMK